MAWTGLFNKKEDKKKKKDEDKQEAKKVDNSTVYLAKKFADRDKWDSPYTSRYYENGEAMQAYDNLQSNFYSWKLKQPNYWDYGKNSGVPVTTNRGVLDRILGTIGNTSIVEGLYNLTDDDESTTFGQGLVSGIRHMNPFEDDVSNRRSFSDVLKNLGWTDDDPNKISGSDVARGVVGFIGDVLLDPITYLNPYSAAVKVVKGSGVTMKGIKALKAAGVIEDVSDLTKGVTKKNIEKLHNLSFNEAKEVIRSTGINANMSDEFLNAQTETFLKNYAKNVERLPDLEDSYGLVLGFMFSSKKKSGNKMSKFLAKELISSEKLARLGDNTIAPFYNTVAKKIRISNIGQKFSNMNKIEALADIKGGAYAFKDWYVGEYLKAFKKIGLDVEDMKSADKIKGWWEGLTEKQQYDWLEAYQDGRLNDANMWTAFKAKLNDAAGNVKDDDILADATKKANLEKQIREFGMKMEAFMNEKVAQLVIPNSAKVERAFGKEISKMNDYELITAMRYVASMKKGSFVDLMKYYNNSVSKYSHLKGKLDDFVTEQEAYKGFLKLDNESKTRLINEYYTGKNILDERALLDEKLVDVFSSMSEVDDLFGGDMIPDLAYLNRQLESIKSGMKNADKFDKDSLEIAELIGKRMEQIAEEEVARGLLTRAQADALRGKYLRHIPTADVQYIEDWIKNPGQFDPKGFGRAKKFDISKGEFKTIYAANVNIDEDGVITIKDAADRIYKDSLHEIFSTRALASNKLIFNTDIQNFVKYHFGKPLKKIGVGEGYEAADKGYSVVVNYAELDRALKKHAYHTYEEIKTAVAKAAKDPDSLKHAKVESKTLEQVYDELLDYFSFGDKNWRTQFVPNVPFQELSKEQLEFIDTQFGIHLIEPFQLQKSILDRTNKLSRTQKVALTNDMLNLFDKMQTIWKLNNTVITPGFHIQNSVSNMFQSFLGTGADALNPSKIRRAYAVMTTKDPKQFITLGGKKYSYRDLEHIARKTGVIEELFHTYEFAPGATQGILNKKFGLPKSLDPTDIMAFAPYKLGTKIGTKIEATQRMNLFMSRLDKGDTIQEAVENVNKFLFDYGELTDFEQEVMKRVIPFYTFMRKNIPMELEAMLQQPTTFTSIQRAKMNIDKLNEDSYQAQNERNEWRQDDLQIPVPIGGKNFGITDNLPYSQFERVFTPHMLAGQTSPFIKVPIELASGKTLYTQMPIDDMGDYTSMLFSYPKIANLAGKKDEGAARNLYILGQLLGFPINEMKQMYEYPDWR